VSLTQLVDDEDDDGYGDNDDDSSNSNNTNIRFSQCTVTSSSVGILVCTSAVIFVWFLIAHSLRGLLFDSEDGGNTFVRNVSGLVPNYTALPPRRSYSSEQWHLIV
jgi:hypothetical protein